MTFIAGYLGAGKTTIINAFLARADRPVAVLVNDVGEINIDARLIRQRSGDTIELTDGCICCSISQGFGAALDQLRDRPTPPDHVVVELSGVSIPHRVLPWANSAGFMLDGVLTVVDVEQLAARMDNAAAATTISSQLEDADLVVLTKSDLVDESVTDSARELVTEIAPSTTIHVGGADEVGLLLQMGGRRPDGPNALPQAGLFDPHEVSTLPLPVGSEGDHLRLLESLPAEVMRAKGVAAGADGTYYLLQRVGGRCSVLPLPAPELCDPTDLVVISLPD